MRRLDPLAVATVVFCATCLPLTHDANAASESDILDATGIKGGLVVHVGCGDGKRTAALRKSEGYLVHGLDTNSKNVEKARQYIGSLGNYGKVSVDTFDGKHLPYTDDLVNLIISEDLGRVSMDEVMRVLCPKGVAYVKQGDQWEKTVKPRPEEIDEWTHYLHAPDNNAVSHDTVVGPPRHFQWMGLPKFARAHEQLASLSACVSAGGRMFYIIDETPRADIRLPSEWFLVARDAFNGVILWKRSIDAWANQFRRFRSGPASLPFRLVADDSNVFVTLDFEAPVSILDAATGKTVRTIENSERTKQIIHQDGRLVLLIDEDMARTELIDEARRRGEFLEHSCRILKAQVDSGKILWKREVAELIFPNMALRTGRLCYQTPTKVCCVDLETGSQLWSVSYQTELDIAENKRKQGELQWESPSLVIRDGIVFCADFAKVRAYSVADGQQLWEGRSSNGYNSPADLLIIDGLVWMSGKGSRNGYDPRTGELQKRIATIKGYMHPRCYRNKGTDKFLMLGDMGVQFVDVQSGDIWQNDWIRGTCQYGIMPANGLLYVPPDSCACNMKTKLNGIFALAAARKTTPKTQKTKVRLQRGLAYADTDSPPSAFPLPPSEDWPTYRHDSRRSGVIKTKIPAKLSRSWQTELGGRLSGVVVAGGKVFVASIDTHCVHALDQNSGNLLWSHTVGARVDSPPTIYQGKVFFGSADGWVYCLRASDGELVWRFRAAPEDRWGIANGQLESVWPVHGSVLIKDGVLTITAGRSSYLDGGIYVYRLDPETAETISQTVIHSPDPDGKQLLSDGRDVRGVLSDILLADGPNIYMRHMKMDFETGVETGTGVHLYSPLGFLDDTWWHRAYWILNDEFTSHWSSWWKVGNRVPSGRIMSYDEKLIVGFGRDQYHGGNTGQWRGGEKYQLFGYDRDSATQVRTPPEAIRRQGSKKKGKRQQQSSATMAYRWTTELPLFARALVVADRTVFVAGPPDLIKIKVPLGDEALELENPEEAVAAWKGEKGGLLWAISARDGEKLAEYDLDFPPVFDGMAAANGQLFMTTTNGSVLCLGKK